MRCVISPGLGGDDAEMLVVAPASGISRRLDWLTNAEDDAHAEADSDRGQSQQRQPRPRTWKPQVGDSDPLQAIEDALRTFAADEIIIVTCPDDQAGWLEEGSGETAQARIPLPVTHVTSKKTERSLRPNG